MMQRILTSTVRIGIALALGLTFIFVAIAACLRQPTFGTWELQGSERAQADLLENHVVYLTYDLSPRDSDHPENLHRAADYVHRHFQDAGADVSELAYEAAGVTYRNVIAGFGPGDLPTVIIGAHYDSFGLFGENPGADDNASGTAGLLELARLLQYQKLSSRVELVAYPNEEPPSYASPAMGSAMHAEHLRGRTHRIWGMVSLEMIGYYTDKQSYPNWLYRLLFPRQGTFVAIAGRWQDRRLTRHFKRSMRATEVPPYSFNPPASLPGIDASDHRSYWQQGFPAIIISDTTFMRNPNYHTAGDTADTLDYGRMAQVIDGVLNGVVRATGL